MHQALYWEVPGYKRGPGRPRANWRSTVNKDLKMGVHLGEHRWQLLTGVGVRPNASSWMRDESRSRSRSYNTISGCNTFLAVTYRVVRSPPMSHFSFSSEQMASAVDMNGTWRKETCRRT